MLGLNIKDLHENNMSRSVDVMMYKKDNTMERTTEFNAVDSSVGHLK